MLGDFVGDYGGRLFVAAGGVGLALLVLVGVLWLLRNRAPSPFVRGGKNRQPRLQVLDAAAVDARRRLVLVRRDGVEHLIMIGGPTDIVIESGIGDTSKTAEPQQPMALQALPQQSEPRPAQRLEAPREPPRMIARKPDAEQPLAPPPPRAAIETPVAPPPERRPAAQPVASAPPVMAPPPVVAEAVKAAPVIERPQPPVQVVAPTPAAPAPEQAVQAPAVVVERKEVAEAVDILEAARQRVLPPQPQPEPPKAMEPERPPVAPPQTPILIQDAYREASIESDVIDPPGVPAITPPKPLGSDFENILEAEMTNNLRAERIVPPAQPAVLPRPAANERRDPERASLGDAALQSEVARIFGEINVKGEK